MLVSPFASSHDRYALPINNGLFRFDRVEREDTTWFQCMKERKKEKAVSVKWKSFQFQISSFFFIFCFVFVCFCFFTVSFTLYKGRWPFEIEQACPKSGPGVNYGSWSNFICPPILCYRIYPSRYCQSEYVPPILSIRVGTQIRPKTSNFMLYQKMTAALCGRSLVV